MVSVANCLVLSYRAIARASALQWQSIECVSEGELDRIERMTRFNRLCNRLFSSPSCSSLSVQIDLYHYESVQAKAY